MSLTAGQVLTAAAYNLDTQKVVASGVRTSDKSSITTEVGVLRVDSITIENGYRYMVVCSPSRLGSGSDSYVQRLRVNQTGTANTTSTQIASAESNDSGSRTMVGYFTASSDSSTCSVIFTAARTSGASSGTWVAESNFNMDIINLGPYPGDTGVDI